MKNRDFLILAGMLFLIVGCFVQSSNKEKKSGDTPATLIEVKKIWDKAEHNAFTDLIRFKNEWFCVFREGQEHADPTGSLRVIRSKDGEKWESSALITSGSGADLRDAKLSVTPDNRLMLSGAERVTIPTDDGRGFRYTHLQSLAWFSPDGGDWSKPHEIGDPDFWLWRVTWHEGIAYCAAKGEHTQINHLRLYTSNDGKEFETYVETLLEKGDPVLEGRPKPSETTIIFTEDGTALSLTHTAGKDGRGAVIGTSKSPYKEWEWKSPGLGIGGPNMIQLPDGRIVAVVRLYVPTRTSLAWIDPCEGTLTEFMVLPSGGDQSYAGLEWYQDMLWISYYSSHEGKTNIYLAKVKF